MGGAAGPVEGVELRGLEHGSPDGGRARRARRGGRDRDRAVQPGDLHRPDPGACPACARRWPRPRAPVVAVSPFVGGHAVKGPTESFCAQAGIEASAAGIVAHYGDLLDGIVADEEVTGLPSLAIDTLMDTPRTGGAWRRASWSWRRRCSVGALAGPMKTLAILPVKTFGAAKQRLVPALPPRGRRSLAEAMVADVLAALARVAGLDAVAVVTADPRARAGGARRGRRGPRGHRAGTGSPRPR